MKNNFNKAFTLVELIVVITILAVLATVAFISFQGYTSSSRDSVRLADLKNISKSFELNRTKGIDFPLPDKKVDISSSGTIFQYQGELSQNILKSDLNIFDGGVDPLSGENYGYAVNSARNKFQVIGFLENGENIANISKNTTFADNSDKYVKSSGDRLGILLDETTNEIIVDENNATQIDIQTNTGSYAVVVDKIKTGNSDFVLGELSFRVELQQSCKAILLSGNSHGDGIYTINPTGGESGEFEVYCDMTTQGGGWTLLLTSDQNSTAFGNNFKDANQWYSSGSLGTLPTDNQTIYSDIDFKSLAYSQLQSNSIRLCLADSLHCYEFEHNKNIALFDFFDQNISYHDAGYNAYGSYDYKYNYSRLDKFQDQLGGNQPYQYKCSWLGINKIRPGEQFNNRNNGSIGLLIDNDGGCQLDEQGLNGHYDNGALGIGLNSCGDGSYPDGGSTCQSGGYVSKAGTQRGLVGGGYNSMIGPWVVWAK